MKPTFRSSELDRILSCYGSITLTRLVDPRDGDEGVEGTGLHFSSAIRISQELGGCTPSGFNLEDAPMAALHKKLKFSKWISDYYVRHVCENAPLGWSLECEAALAYEFDRFILSGHIDCVALNPDATEAIGWDLKTGYDPVDVADSNEQILGYSVLLKRAYPSLNKVTFYIVQPRNDEDEGHPRVSAVVIDSLIDASVASLESRLVAAIDNALELNTGRKQCKYCIGCSCPAIRQLMKLTLTSEMLATVKRQPDDSILGDFVVAGCVLSKPMEDAEEMLHARLDKAPAIVAGDGTQITRKIQRGKYTVPDPLAFFGAVKEMLPRDDQLARVMTPSMTRIKDELADAMHIPKTGKAATTAEGVFDAKLRPLVEQGEKRLLVFT